MSKFAGVVAVGIIALPTAFAGCEKKAATIESECVMNGFGSGHCTFTNTGEGAGTVCGHVQVMRTGGNGEAMSGVFCSGEVRPSSTTKVEFTAVGVGSLCAGEDWRQVCSFTFVKKD